MSAINISEFSQAKLVGNLSKLPINRIRSKVKPRTKDCVLTLFSAMSNPLNILMVKLTHTDSRQGAADRAAEG